MRSVFVGSTFPVTVTIKDDVWDVDAVSDALSSICDVIDGDERNLYCEVSAVWDEDDRGSYSNPAADKRDFYRVLDDVVDDYRVDFGSESYNYEYI